MIQINRCWGGDTERRRGMDIEYVTFGGARYTPEEFAAFAAAHPEAFLPPVPTLDQVRAAKLSELRSAAETAATTGVMTTPGLVMRYGQEDCVLVDGIVRYTELKGLATVPKLIDANGTIHTDVSLANGKTIQIEQFEAANAADTKLRTLTAQALTATTAEAVAAIRW